MDTTPQHIDTLRRLRILCRKTLKLYRKMAKICGTAALRSLAISFCRFPSPSFAATRLHFPAMSGNKAATPSDFAENSRKISVNL
jgi:hypothetical protein